jgi:NADH:ubiquinone oxidoreductase subunit 5 (subunit L)/multisubunit Na+/H+ antiporter MnhA subunit
MSTGPGASIRQIREDHDRTRQQREAELTLTRTRAASWSKGIGALLAAGLTFSLIKGRSEVNDLAQPYAVAVGVLLALGILLAMVTAFYLFRASFGRLTPTPAGTPDRTLARETMRDLRVGLVVALGGAVLLVVAVGLTWYGPSSSGPQIEVIEQSGATWCGEPVRASSGRMTLQSDGQEVEFDVTTVARLRAVPACP